MPQIQNLRGTAANLTSVNPVLLAGEMILETDTGRIKFGDGTSSWNSLPYAILPNSGVSISGALLSSSSGNFTSLSVGGIAVSVSGHTHCNITNAGAIGSTANLPLITTTAGVITAGSFGSSANTFCVGNDSRLSDSRTPLSHTHGNITNAGAIGSTANLPLITTTAGAITVGSFGNTANSFCVGNDSRLSDTRTPTDGTVTTAKIVNANVTYAKIQNVSATDRILGRSSAGAGVVQEITCTSFGRSLIDDADAAAARVTIGCPPTGSPTFTGTSAFANATFASSTVPVVSITSTSSTEAAILQIKGRTSDGAGFIYFTNNAGSVNNGFLTGFNGTLQIYGGNYVGPLTIAADGSLSSQPTYDQTAAGSNVVVTSAGLLRRTSSSIKYKKDVEDLDINLTNNAIDNLRPVWYRSKNPTGDDKVEWSQIGLIAEEAALVEPRIVRYKTVQVVEENGQRTETPLETPEPEDIDYGRLTVLLLAEIKNLKSRIIQLESQINNS
jgi:hypothetical protein